MCAYQLKCPDTSLAIQKATGLMMSEHDRSSKCIRSCAGSHEHRHVAGKLSSGQSVSSFVAEYTPCFVQDMLKLLVPHHFQAMDTEVLLTETGNECLAGEDQAQVEAVAAPDQVAGEEGTPAMHSALKRLRANLGHPSNKDLVRILKRINASETAIRMAQQFQCSVCENNKQPSSALPAKTSRVLEFNQKVGLDVKYVNGWKPNQLIPCIRIVDYATSLHVVVPIFRRETGEIIKGVLRDSWIMWAGPPEILEMDPAKPNLSAEVGNLKD